MNKILRVISLALVMCWALPCPAATQCLAPMSLGEVTDDSVEPLVKALNDAHGAPVEIIINSGGGSVYAGLELIGAIEKHGHVTCTVTDMAASMALSIYSTCQVRRAYPRAILMGHEPSVSTLVHGTPNQIAALALRMKALHQSMCEHLASHSRLSAREWYARTVGDQEYWIGISEAQAIGLVDQVVTP